MVEQYPPHSNYRAPIPTFFEQQPKSKGMEEKYTVGMLIEQEKNWEETPGSQIVWQQTGWLIPSSVIFLFVPLKYMIKI